MNGLSIKLSRILYTAVSVFCAAVIFFSGHRFWLKLIFFLLAAFFVAIMDIGKATAKPFNWLFGSLTLAAFSGAVYYFAQTDKLNEAVGFSAVCVAAFFVSNYSGMISKKKPEADKNTEDGEVLEDIILKHKTNGDKIGQKQEKPARKKSDKRDKSWAPKDVSSYME